MLSLLVEIGDNQKLRGDSSSYSSNREHFLTRQWLSGKVVAERQVETSFLLFCQTPMQSRLYFVALKTNLTIHLGSELPSHTSFSFS